MNNPEGFQRRRAAYKLAEMRRALLMKLGRGAEALDSAWTKFQAHPDNVIYDFRSTAQVREFVRDGVRWSSVTIGRRFPVCQLRLGVPKQRHCKPAAREALRCSCMKRLTDVLRRIGTDLRASGN